jgi:hypothetical protein
MDPLLFLLLSIVSLGVMKNHYEYLQDRSQRKMLPGETRAFENLQFIMNIWLIVMWSVTLLLALVHPAVIFLILFFYVYILNLTPQLIYQFFPNLNLR